MKTLNVITRYNKKPSAHRFIGQYQSPNGKWHDMGSPYAMGADLDIVAKHIIDRQEQIAAQGMMVLPYRIIKYKLTTADIVSDFLGRRC